MQERAGRAPGSPSDGRCGGVLPGRPGRRARTGPAGRRGVRSDRPGRRAAGTLDGIRGGGVGPGRSGRRGRPVGGALGSQPGHRSAARAPAGLGRRLRPGLHRTQVGERPVRTGTARGGRGGGECPHRRGGGGDGVRGPAGHGGAARIRGVAPAGTGERGGRRRLHPWPEPGARPAPAHARGGGQRRAWTGRAMVGGRRARAVRPRAGGRSPLRRPSAPPAGRPFGRRVEVAAPDFV